MTPWAREKLAADPEERARIFARADAMGVRLGALYAPKKREWQVSASGHGITVQLRAHGKLVTVLDGVMDDFIEATVAA